MTDPAISTKEKPGAYDAFETAKPDEPIFTLQGGDPIAPLVIMVWAWKARQFARTLDNEKEATRLLTKASAAEEVAWAMKDYQKGGAQEVAAVRATINDTPDTLAEAQEAVTERKRLIEGVTKLQNAIGVARDVSEALETVESISDQIDAIEAGIYWLKLAAEGLEPRRGSERS